MRKRVAREAKRVESQKQKAEAEHVKAAKRAAKRARVVPSQAISVTQRPTSGETSAAAALIVLRTGVLATPNHPSPTTM